MLSAVIGTPFGGRLAADTGYPILDVAAQPGKPEPEALRKKSVNVPNKIRPLSKAADPFSKSIFCHW